MKVLEKDRKNRAVKLLVEDEEDLWILRTVIRDGDLVTAKTTRDVRVSDTGESERRPMTLKVRVKSTEFQPFTGNLRVKGVIVEGPERYGLKGSWHTLSIKPGSELVLEKPGGWSSAELSRVDRKAYTGKALIVAVDYDEYAIALVGMQGLKLLEEGELYIPGKDDPSRDTVLEGSINKIAERSAALSSQEKADTIIVVGPGFLKEMVARKLEELAHGKRVEVDDASMGGVKGVEEALRRDKIHRVLRELESVKAEALLEEFYRLLHRDPDRVAYTLPDVLSTVRIGAASILAILDELLYSPDEKERSMAEEVLGEASRYRVEALIVPHNTPAGDRLRPLGGAVALLRYRLPREARGSLGSDEGEAG